MIFDSFENGVTIKLPQEHMERAWEKFVKINNQYGNGFQSITLYLMFKVHVQVFKFLNLDRQIQVTILL